MDACIKEESKVLASLAVFRQLYDQDEDIYGVISEFLTYIIENKGMYKFSATEITDVLNNTFDFLIPEAVVKTSIGRLKPYITRDNGYYLVNANTKKSSSVVSKIQQDTISNNNIIIESLFDYIESKKTSSLTELEKEKIVHSFCSILLDSSNGEQYAEYISSFILDNSNTDFQNSLNQIREGVLLYSGLKYNNIISETGSWKTELTIYMDTEILFHIAGYNGQVFKSLFQDFYNYIREINNKASKRLIKLTYFKEVQEEIDSYFSIAERIIEGNSIAEPHKTAMNSIISGCKAPSDIIQKKSEFYLLLEEHRILLDSNDKEFYDTDNFKYNIIDHKTIDKINNEFGFDTSEHFQFLNYISILRGKHNQKNFSDIRYILLTGKKRTTKVAWHELVKLEGAVPLATSLDWITNKFWFKLNKGFGNGELPRSVNIITKAQIILSSLLNESIGKKYNELVNQYKTGDMDERKAKAVIVELRSHVKRPEDIEQGNTGLILDLVSQDNLEALINEHDSVKIENVHLKRKLHGTTIEKKEMEQKDILNKIDQTQLKIIKIDKNIDLYTRVLGGLLVFLFCIYAYFISTIDWDKFEKWAYLFDILILIFPISILLFTEKTISPKCILKNYKKRLRDKQYQRHDVDIDFLNECKVRVNRLNMEITHEKQQLLKLI